jgi:hypothetical protein
MRTLDVYAELSIHVDAAAAQLLEQDSADAETIRNETTRSSAN